MEMSEAFCNDEDYKSHVATPPLKKKKTCIFELSDISCSKIVGEYALKSTANEQIQQVHFNR